MSEEITLPGAPTPRDFVEFLTNPDLSEKGVVVVDGEDLPSDEELGHMVRAKILTPGQHVKPDVIPPRRIVVVDKSRPELLPDVLRDADVDTEEREEWLSDLSRDIFINLLAGGEDEELGKMVRESLMEQGEVYDKEEEEVVPGYYDPADNDEPHIGEERAYVVVMGS